MAGKATRRTVETGPTGPSQSAADAAAGDRAAGGPVAPAADAAGVTPSMAQFLEIKAANPDSILWYRMGDFYELFFEDAVVVADALSITLTKRGKHLGEDIPMCGVPVVRADEYLQRLIRKGFRVAVCEQLEDPAEAKKRGSKAVVRRDVVRLVTPGTLTEDALLDARRRNYLAALFPRPATKGVAPTYAIAALDISSGDFEVATVGEADLAGELVRLGPGEVIAADATLRADAVERALGYVEAARTPVPAVGFDSQAGERLLKERLGVIDLAGVSVLERHELAAVAAVLRYVDLTQLGAKPLIRPPRRTGPGAVMMIDAATRSSLELVRSTSGERSSTLLAAIDRTVTGAGARELASRLASPLSDLATIQARLDAVGFLAEREALREEVRDVLRRSPDIARALSRLSLQRGTPRDLGAVRDGLACSATLARSLDRAGAGMGLPVDLGRLQAAFTGVPATLGRMLTAALVAEPPALRRDGGFVTAGFRAELDETRGLRDDSRRVLMELEATYIAHTGIKSLKVRHNNILGYFIEVSQANARPLTEPPHAETFRHRQSVSNAMRFTTAELARLEGRIAAAADRALALEQEIFAELSAACLAESERLARLAQALADLDVTAGLADVAVAERYVRPALDASCAFVVEGGRHPVVEQALKTGRSGVFIENDCALVEPMGRIGGDEPSGHGFAGFDEATIGRLWIVTGPNMAGKSTFLRQNALIVVLAQMGSYVPARRCHIGLVDRLFSRVGAADDLARGRSTFMVEMVETAAILNQATERSLVILDEIGRGTATFDGLSIAWATVEYLHGVSRCRALFATHYHELTALAAKLDDIANVTMDVKEWQDEIVFLHKVKPGAADRSYGIQVAKLAGLPAAVIKRAGEVLRRLEKADRRAPGADDALSDLPLFAAVRPSSHVPAASTPALPSPLEAALATVQADELTPRAALELVYRLKEIARGGR